MTENWYDERGMNDAPIWYDSNQAAAWASGYNAAVEEYKTALEKAFAKESGLSG